ncbi:MAG TPA: CD225/dispanin family protein [Mucilaginibacter sp.]
MDQSQPGAPLQPRPKNWLVESILVTLFCCLPFGIAGIVYASAVNSKYDAGDYAGALYQSQQAAKWTKIGFWIGIAGVVIYFILMFTVGISFFSTRNF